MANNLNRLNFWSVNLIEVICETVLKSRNCLLYLQQRGKLPLQTCLCPIHQLHVYPQQTVKCNYVLKLALVNMKPKPAE